MSSVARCASSLLHSEPSSSNRLTPALPRHAFRRRRYSRQVTCNARWQPEPDRRNTRVQRDPYYDNYQMPDYAPPGGNGSQRPQDQSGGRPPGPPPGPGGTGDGEWKIPAMIAGAFFLGIGAGVWFTEDVNLYPNNVASTELVDRRTPNSELCMANGYSAMVFDQRLFVSFNPFNVYVTQPEIKPGCVLRRSNYSVLEKRKLVSREESEACQRGMNNFAFVGDLEQSPEVSCVYHSEAAENQYLVNPLKSRMGDGQRPLDAPPTDVP